MSDLVKVDDEVRPAAALLDMRPKDMVVRATEIANVLKDIIRQQNLVVKIGPSEHVKADGWAALGSMMNVVPKERNVIEHEDGSFEAYVDLVNVRTGNVVGGGSALCGMDESRWKKADRYARRSMAITRATGKAYRLCFAWVMALAGYNTTPAEEMPWDESSKKEKPKAEATDSEQKEVVYTGETLEQKKTLAKVMEAQGVPNEWKRPIHETIINWKVKHPDWLDDSVKTCMKYINEGKGLPDEIPF